MIRDDLARSAELVQRGNPQGARSRSALDVPQALHDELEVRGFDAQRSTVPLDGPDTARAELDPADTDSVEDAFDEGILGEDLVALQLVPATQRPDDRRASGRAVEPVESEHVREELRNVRLEAIEARQRVLAKREQHVDPQRPVHGCRERLFEWPAASRGT